jgi:uncharacterized membrane-anchored protein
MKPILHFVIIGKIIAIAAFFGACSTNPKTPGDDLLLKSAWSSWKEGDFEDAAMRAQSLLSNEETSSAGHFILTLAAHINGDYSGAVKHFKEISPDYRWIDLLIEPVLWSYVFLEDFEEAITLGKSRSRQGRDRKATIG